MHRGGGGGGGKSGGGQRCWGGGGSLAAGCTGPLRPERCARVGIRWVGGGGRCVRGADMGVGVGGGGGGSTSKSRPLHHKYKSPKQFL